MSNDPVGGASAAALALYSAPTLWNMFGIAEAAASLTGFDSQGYNCRRPFDFGNTNCTATLFRFDRSIQNNPTTPTYCVEIENPYDKAFLSFKGTPAWQSVSASFPQQKVVVQIRLRFRGNSITIPSIVLAATYVGQTTPNFATGYPAASDNVYQIGGAGMCFQAYNSSCKFVDAFCSGPNNYHYQYEINVIMDTFTGVQSKLQFFLGPVSTVWPYTDYALASGVYAPSLSVTFMPLGINFNV